MALEVAYIYPLHL